MHAVTHPWEEMWGVLGPEMTSNGLKAVFEAMEG